MNATISADIVSSTSLSSNVLERLQNEIAAFIDSLERQNGVDCFWGRLAKGDSIECFIKNPNEALRIALLIKALVKKTKLLGEGFSSPNRNRLKMFKTHGVRIAIGVGEMRVADKRLNILDGEAIYASGRALENQRTSNKAKITIKNTLFFDSPSLDLTAQVNAFLGLVDVLFMKATERQCEIVYHRLLGMNEKEIANKLGIKQSAVNQHSTLVGWNAIEQLLKYFEQIKF